MSEYFMDNKNWIASRDALTENERKDWIMGEKIRLVCEGNLNCKNQVELTKEEVIELNNQSKLILCNDCKPRYENDIREMPLPMNEFEGDIDKPSNPEEPV